jgi:hypothetical protein
MKPIQTVYTDEQEHEEPEPVLIQVLHLEIAEVNREVMRSGLRPRNKEMKLVDEDATKGRKSDV